jgi:hypothetical protein
MKLDLSGCKYLCGQGLQGTAPALIKEGKGPYEISNLYEEQTAKGKSVAYGLATSYQITSSLSERSDRSRSPSKDLEEPCPRRRTAVTCRLSNQET